MPFPYYIGEMVVAERRRAIPDSELAGGPTTSRMDGWQLELRHGYQLRCRLPALMAAGSDRASAREPASNDQSGLVREHH